MVEKVPIPIGKNVCKWRSFVSYFNFRVLKKVYHYSSLAQVDLHVCMLFFQIKFQGNSGPGLLTSFALGIPILNHNRVRKAKSFPFNIQTQSVY
jgi:hypothetical protein